MSATPRAPDPTAGAGRAADGSPLPDRRRASFEREVRAMFEHIARGYEGFDHLASMGQDLLWRPRALWDVDRYRGGRPPPQRILDVGCGTGELSRLAARHYPNSHVVGLDFTDGMLRSAARPGRAGRARERIRYVRGTSNRLPFRDTEFDLVLSAFVTRNFPDLPRAVSEMSRVLAPGGTYAALDITGPAAPRARALFLAYFDTVVPWLGAAVGSAGPYRYLPESLRHLPDRAGILALLTGIGLERPRAAPQSLGIVTTYLAKKPD